MGLEEWQEAAEYWAGPEGVALRNQEEVTGISTIPAENISVNEQAPPLAAELVKGL